MLDSAKYITMKNGEHGTEYAVVFNPIQSHAVMARRMGGECWRQFILGAGECSIYVGDGDYKQHVQCYGRSVTLNRGLPEGEQIVCRGYEDAYLIAQALFGLNGQHEAVIDNEQPKRKGSTEVDFLKSLTPKNPCSEIHGPTDGECKMCPGGWNPGPKVTSAVPGGDQKTEREC
jgi:hypothetical protein